MAGVSETAIARGHLGRAGGLLVKLAVKFAFLFDLFKEMPSQSKTSIEHRAGPLTHARVPAG